MSPSDILAFLNKNPACHLATVDGAKPRVRGMLIYRADEQGILLHTGTQKDLYKQLKRNPNVELCFNDSQENIQIRVSGEAEEVKDEKLKAEIVEARPFMKPWIEKYGKDFLAVVRVRKAAAVVWTMATNFAPKEPVSLS